MRHLETGTSQSCIQPGRFDVRDPAQRRFQLAALPLPDSDGSSSPQPYFPRTGLFSPATTANMSWSCPVLYDQGQRVSKEGYRMPVMWFGCLLSNLNMCLLVQVLFLSSAMVRRVSGMTKHTGHWRRLTCVCYTTCDDWQVEATPKRIASVLGTRRLQVNRLHEPRTSTRCRSGALP